MKVYVAGEEKPLVNAVQQALTEAGHTITYDWTAAVTDADTLLHRRTRATAVLDGIRHADALVLLVHHSAGLRLEFGIAVSMGTPTILIQESAVKDSEFLAMPRVSLFTLERLDPQTVCDHVLSGLWDLASAEKITALALSGSIDEMATAFHKNSVDHGWWSNPNIPEKLALIHSEISEALEEYRNYELANPIYYNARKPEGFLVELADAVIRILDLVGYVQSTREHEAHTFRDIIAIKHAFNVLRPYRHGGKKC